VVAAATVAASEDDPQAAANLLAAEYAAALEELSAKAREAGNVATGILAGTFSTLGSLLAGLSNRQFFQV